MDQMYLINDFRITIVHDTTSEFYNIAEPSGTVMETIYDYFLKPIKIVYYLNNNDYGNSELLSPDDNLEKVLDFISKYNFSQFPVFEGIDLLE